MVQRSDRNWVAVAGIGVLALSSGLPSCGRGTSPTLPGPESVTTKSAGSSLPDPSAHVGIWLEPTKTTGLWAEQHEGSCVVTDIVPALGHFELGGKPTSIRLTIYDTCRDTHLVRLDFQGPINPLVSCPGMPELENRVPFKVSWSGTKPAVDVECKLVADPCNDFIVDVDTFPPRERELKCALQKTGQIEFDPW